MLSRPIAAVAEKAASSRIVEYACTTAGILVQIGVTSYMNNYLGGSDNPTVQTNSESPNADTGHTAAYQVPRTTEPSDIRHTDENDQISNQRFGRMS